MNRLEGKKHRMLRRKRHIRKKIHGTVERPRMTVFKSNRHVYVQVIDDAKGHTLVSASNLESAHRDLKRTVEDAEKLGQLVGERLKEKKIGSVVFDRNGYKYQGIVRAIAEGARKAGITI
ncbi:MAG: 50S ribosomal protein L18 [Spirochaetales bacterium]|nr:50S ribosomal protein L18 [Spirochaetales bacterium]